MEKAKFAFASMPEDKRLQVLAKRAAQSSKQLEENRLRKQNQSLETSSTSAHQNSSYQTQSTSVRDVVEKGRLLEEARARESSRRALLKSPSLTDFMLLSPSKSRLPPLPVRMSLILIFFFLIFFNRGTG